MKLQQLSDEVLFGGKTINNKELYSNDSSIATPQLQLLQFILAKDKAFVKALNSSCRKIGKFKEAKEPGLLHNGLDFGFISKLDPKNKFQIELTFYWGDSSVNMNPTIHLMRRYDYSLLFNFHAETLLEVYQKQELIIPKIVEILKRIYELK